MNFFPIFSALGMLVGLVGLFMIPSLILSLVSGDGLAGHWLITLVIVEIIGALLWVTGRQGGGRILQREAIVVVVIGWALVAGMGSLPYLITGAIPGVADAYFESMSGFTTTGSTILTDIESMPRSILLWRSMTQWLGGIGIIVLFIAILPFFSAARQRLYASEIPGINQDGLTLRIRDTARAMLKIYLILSVAECLLLLVLGMNLFDAVCHTFTTIATAGFSTRNGSIAAFDSLFIELVMIVFMILAGCNFTLHYFFLNKHWKTYWKDVEFRAYIRLLLAAVVILCLVTWISGTAGSFGKSLRDSLFTATAIMTSTGYATADYNAWPATARVLIVILMFIGACGGSTSGGMKVIRHLLTFRFVLDRIQKHYSPRLIKDVKIGGRIVDDSLVQPVLGFFIAIFILLGFFTLLVTILEPGLDMVSCFSAVASTLNNIGPALGAFGPTENFACLQVESKWILSFCMLLGRLEIFSVLVLFAPRFWSGV